VLYYPAPGAGEEEEAGAPVVLGWTWGELLALLLLLGRKLHVALGPEIGCFGRFRPAGPDLTLQEMHNYVL